MLTDIKLDNRYKKFSTDTVVLNENRERKHMCYICMKKFSTFPDLYNHKTIHNPTEKKNDIVEENDLVKCTTFKKSNNAHIVKSDKPIVGNRLRNKYTQNVDIHSVKHSSKTTGKLSEIRNISKVKGLGSNNPGTSNNFKMYFECLTCKISFRNLQGIKAHNKKNKCILVHKEYKIVNSKSTSGSDQFKFASKRTNHSQKPIILNHNFTPSIIPTKLNEIPPLRNDTTEYINFTKDNVENSPLSRSDRTVVTNKEINEFTCELCYDVFTSKEDLDDHIDFHKQLQKDSNVVMNEDELDIVRANKNLTQSIDSIITSQQKQQSTVRNDSVLEDRFATICAKKNVQNIATNSCNTISSDMQNNLTSPVNANTYPFYFAVSDNNVTTTMLDQPVNMTPTLINANDLLTLYIMSPNDENSIYLDADSQKSKPIEANNSLEKITTLANDSIFLEQVDLCDINKFSAKQTHLANTFLPTKSVNLTKNTMLYSPVESTSQKTVKLMSQQPKGSKSALRQCRILRKSNSLVPQSVPGQRAKAFRLESKCQDKSIDLNYHKKESVSLSRKRALQTSISKTVQLGLDKEQCSVSRSTITNRSNKLNNFKTDNSKFILDTTTISNPNENIYRRILPKGDNLLKSYMNAKPPLNSLVDLASMNANSNVNASVALKLKDAKLKNPAFTHNISGELIKSDRKLKSVRNSVIDLTFEHQTAESSLSEKTSNNTSRSIKKNNNNANNIKPMITNFTLDSTHTLNLNKNDELKSSPFRNTTPKTYNNELVKCNWNTKPSSDPVRNQKKCNNYDQNPLPVITTVMSLVSQRTDHENEPTTTHEAPTMNRRNDFNNGVDDIESALPVTMIMKQ